MVQWSTIMHGSVTVEHEGSHDICCSVAWSYVSERDNEANVAAMEFPIVVSKLSAHTSLVSSWVESCCPSTNACC